MAVAGLFGEREVRNKSIAFFQAYTRQVRYTPVADVSLRRSEPPLRARMRHSNSGGDYAAVDTPILLALSATARQNAALNISSGGRILTI
jgi:hypothetical protein